MTDEDYRISLSPTGALIATPKQKLNLIHSTELFGAGGGSCSISNETCEDSFAESSEASVTEAE